MWFGFGLMWVRLLVGRRGMVEVVGVGGLDGEVLLLAGGFG